MKYTGTVTVIRNLFYCLDQVFKTRFLILKENIFKNFIVFIIL